MRVAHGKPDCTEVLPMRRVLFFCLVLIAKILVTSDSGRAQAPDRYLRDIETKYIFGITEGSGIGLEGEKEFSPETIARFGKAGGHYFGSETKLEYEFTPNQYVQFELGPLVSAHRIKDVANLDNRSGVEFGGFFGEMRYQLLDRGPSPLAVTLSV